MVSPSDCSRASNRLCFQATVPATEAPMLRRSSVSAASTIDIISTICPQRIVLSNTIAIYLLGRFCRSLAVAGKLTNGSFVVVDRNAVSGWSGLVTCELCRRATLLSLLAENTSCGLTMVSNTGHSLTYLAIRYSRMSARIARSSRRMVLPSYSGGKFSNLLNSLARFACALPIVSKSGSCGSGSIMWY